MRFVSLVHGLLVLVPLGLTASPAHAQEASLNVLLFEKSYAGVGTPDVIGSPDYYADVAEPDLLAEAQIAPHLALHRGLVVDEIKYGEGRGFNLFLTPQIRLRGYDVPSGPVRSLSFMPKLTFQWLWSRGQDPDDPLAPGARRVYGFDLVLGHHSNGGSTCEFVDEVQVEDRGCVVPGGGPVPAPEDREIRVEGGNFSTNYIQVGGGYRYGVTSDVPVEHWRWLVEGAVAFQHHHDWIGFPLPGGPDEAFGELYGLDRLRLDAAGHAMLSDRVALRGSARLDVWDADAERFAGARDYTLQTDLFLQYVGSLPNSLPSILGAGIRYSRGMDYYNTQYAKDISHLQGVLFLDLWSPIFR